MSEAKKNKPSGRSGKKNSEEHNRKVSESLKINTCKIKWNSRKCSIDGMIYNSASEAAREIGESDCTVMYRLKSDSPKYSNYIYI